MPALDTLRKAAKRWLKSLRDGSTDARARLHRAYPGAPERVTLRDVQHALAREHGFESWMALTRGSADSTPNVPPLIRLLAAAGEGDTAAAAAILDAHPALINERGSLEDSGLRTALHFGVGHEAMVRLLLERGADPNIRDEGDHAFPIHFAAERGHLSIVTLLVEHGADADGAGTTHLLDVVGWAVCFDYAHHVDVARYLLAHGARLTLVSAVALGETDAIRSLVQAGADLNQRMDKTNHRRTPAHLAVIKKQSGSLATLIELGADLNVEDAVGLTPLDEAALKGDAAMARLLIDAGATITLPAAIVLDRDDEIERRLAADPEALSTDNRRWARLLVHASARSSGHVIETLLRTVMRHRSGLSIVNMPDDRETAVDGASDYTALHSAAFQGNNDVVAVLLKHGANPRTRDGKYCSTPAGWAAYAGHAATAQLILDGDIDIFDAISFDRSDRVADILDRDAGALERPFKAYASCPSKDDQWWPPPNCTPLEWATSRKKEHALRVLTERGAGTRTRDQRKHQERVVEFLQSACWDHEVHGVRTHRMHDRAAQRLLADDPAIAAEDLYCAAVCGNDQEVARILAAHPEAARQRGGARGWTPILYLAYTRLTHPPTIERALTIARLLLDHGADPNDFYMAGDSRYTVLVGVAGEGEQDAPRQPYAAALFRLLLERGAEPFDIQILYNTHFSGDVLWWLDLVYTHTVDGPRGTAWRDPNWAMFDMGGYGTGARFLLELAVKKRDITLAEWLLARGANPNAAPPRDPRFPKRSLYELAVMENLGEMAGLLERHGAVRSAPVLDEREQFVHACFALDRDAARQHLRAHPEYLKVPDALFEAARRNRPDVLAFLLDLGVPIEISNATGQRALHEAAVRGSLEAARFLIEHGAEIDPRESRYGAAPIGWATHGNKIEMVELLSQYSRDICVLAFNGCVDRLRVVLREDPALARDTTDGRFPLRWLPDEEAIALQIVDLLLAAGADASVKNAEGETAADAARRRGMHAVALRLDRAI